MDTILADFASHPAWKHIMEALDQARVQATNIAARDVENHARSLGKLEGLEWAVRVIKERRKQFNAKVEG